MATPPVPAPDHEGTALPVADDGGDGGHVDASGRDWLIDLVRIGSVAVVVLLHWLYLRVWVEDDVMHTELALRGPVFWALSWALMVMPLFFIAGGFANTRVLDRLRSLGGTSADFLAIRVRRLLSPVLFLVVVTFLVVAAVAAIDPGSAARLTDRAGLHLWFVAAFLACIAVAPSAVSSHRRHGPWALPAMLLLGSFAVDAARFGGVIDMHMARWPNLILVWLFCHQLGVVHARGTLSRWPMRRLAAAVVGAVGLLWVLVAVGPYPVANVGMADVVGTNLMPPTSVMSVLGVVHLMVLTMVSRAIGDWVPGDHVRSLVRWCNPRLMVIYLWHVPALAGVTFVGLLAPELLLPADPGWWWLLRPFWIALSLVLLAACARMALAWEVQGAQLPVRVGGTGAMTAAVLGSIGIAVLWRAGIGPAAAPILGCVLVVLAVGLVTKGRDDRGQLPVRAEQ